ncbi:tetratricopeptide repeat-containing sulfotransferase family protein [Henriciella aquimarina]|uniref:tetratricopeptide repeat-containing sulfotransferase family protein n=1 Tax=Henriciella aquimarina TaxID=545261 RepID=UPI001F1F3575|nr:tetratricopeptide repeat-containing sulfotransferase family protein [Henriciella aquimarina]
MTETSPQTDLLAHARTALQAGDFARAAEAATAAVAASPDDADALYIQAVSLRYLGQHDRALQALASLRRARPGYGRAWQEEAHCLRDMNRTGEARAAYAEAVRLNPALTASWHELARLHEALGDMPAARLAQEQANRLAALPRELAAAASMIHEDRIARAETIVRAWQQKHPKDVEGMRLLAEIGARLNVVDDAEFLLSTAVALDPDHALARLDYIGILHKRQKYAEALEQAKILREKFPGHPVYDNAYAGEALAVGDFDEALRVYDQILETMPDSAQIQLVRGHALKTIGKREEAEAAYRAACRSKPDFGDAYWSLANLKTYSFSEDEIEQMQAAEADPRTALPDRYHLCFALGKAFEDRGDADAAFQYYARGNELKRDELGYSPERMEQEMERQKAVCTPALFSAQGGQGHEAPDPIFIVGLPRAGSTLIEQILASHSMVDGTLELPNILALVHRLNGRRRAEGEPRYPAILETLPADQLEAFGRQYIDETRIYREGAPFFTDKMPNNFRHIGLIQLILPNAKIIDARREPMACCFSGFKQLFAEGQEFSYSLEDIGHYYRDYVDLMDHWDRVLPGKILRVQHEDVVADLEGQVHRILDYCGLPFEQACIDFHKTKRAVRTASSEQVRQPINTAGLDQWRRFELHLAPLKQALGPDLAPQLE